MESVIQSPTPTPTKSVSTFSLDTLENSIEYPRLARNMSVSRKNQFLNDFASKISHNIEQQKTKLGNANRNSNKIEEDMSITSTSDILNFDNDNNEAHKSLTSLPENPINKLLNNAITVSANQLSALKNENRLLKKKVEQLQKASTQQASKPVKTADETLIAVNESLVKKVKKYKALSESQAEMIQELKDKIKQLSSDVVSEERRHPGKSSDDTDILLSLRKNQKDTNKTSVDDDKSKNDIEKLRAEIFNFIHQMSDLSNQEKKQQPEGITKGEAFTPKEQKNASENSSDAKNDSNQGSKQLNDIKNQIDEIKQHLTNRSNNFQKPIQASDTADIGVRNDDDIIIVEQVLQKYIKRKKLEDELASLRTDEYLNYIDEIANPLIQNQKPQKPNPSARQLRSFPRSISQYDRSIPAARKKNIDLHTLKTFKSAHEQELTENGTWMDEPTQDFGKEDLDDILASLNQEYQDLLNQYHRLSKETLSNDPNVNFKANKRSMDLLNELLNKIDKKRQEIYKLSQIFGQNDDVSGTLEGNNLIW